ncbi:MAG TPA: adenine phosphoribosyltransferase, partial [Arenibacter sp.]|nr:adenine phosphoribosyltransferase [Arenibacter sp.]
MDFKKYVRDIPDFPEKGISFKDITPLLQDANALASAAEA